MAALRDRFAGRVLSLAGASFLQALLSIALFPLATRILGAADFGVYALMMSVVTLATALADGGAGLALPAHYGPLEREQRGRLLATFFSVSGVLSVGLAIVLMLAWPWRGLLSPDLGDNLSFMIALLCALLIPLRAAGVVATTTFSVSGRGAAIAGQICAQALATFCGTLAGLFVLRLGVVSLFFGAVCGAFANVATAALLLGQEPWRRPARRWLAVALANAPTAAFAGLVDGVRAVAENALIGRSASLRAIGYYAHAKLYYSLALMGTNAVAHNMWAPSLGEARQPEPAFPQTGQIWSLVHMVVALAGIGTVVFGDLVISVLTNDTLTPAARFLPWLFIILLVHLSGRSALALLFAEGLGAEITRRRAAIALAALAALPLIVADFAGIGLDLGIPGVLLVLFAEALIYRLYLRYRSSAFGTLPFQDGWALAGVIAIAGFAGWREMLEPPLWALVLAFLGFVAVSLPLIVFRALGLKKRW
nr:oligosaccharide flippase family protein [Afifella sp. IM 167]